jgi:hypothetical protein
MSREIPGFDLMATQAENARVVAEKAQRGELMPKQAIYHLIGISAYISEVSRQMLDDLEEGRL